MRHYGLLLGCIIVLAGCAGSQRRESIVATYSSGARPSISETAQSPNPQTRPGLATEWGETRYSRVNRQRFVRSSGSPFATATIRYNDVTGVAHQAAYREARQGQVSYVCAYGDGVRVAIVDEHGNPLPGRLAGDALYVIGHHGRRYSIVLTNTTSARFEAVVSVDGLDVINGQSGSFANRGYLLRPHGTVRIDGFRQSDTHVAAFRFGTVADSYAAQSGSARNVGAIGVALFSERGWVPQPVHPYGDEIELRESSDPFPNRYAPPPSHRRYY